MEVDTMTTEQIESKVNEMLKGKTFEELVEIWNGLNNEKVNPYINELIMNHMEIVDAVKFEQWLDA